MLNHNRNRSSPTPASSQSPAAESYQSASDQLPEGARGTEEGRKPGQVEMHIQQLQTSVDTRANQGCIQNVETLPQNTGEESRAPSKKNNEEKGQGRPKIMSQSVTWRDTQGLKLSDYLRHR